MISRRLAPYTLALLTLCAITPAAFAAGKIEVGNLNGAAYRIDVPENWNHSLVIYCHGYSPFPGEFKEDAPDAFARAFLDAGFALARSGYSTGGWAIEQAELETMSLKRYFGSKYGIPKQVFVTGHSMGGFLTMLLSERYPSEFAGSMPMCGPLQPTLQLLHKVFDDQVVFTYFLPGVLPEPHDVSADYKPSDQIQQQIVTKLKANPAALAALKRYSGLDSADDIAGQAAFWTYILKEIYARAGGFPFDNRGTIYWNTGSDNELNAAAKRYAADAKAVTYLRTYYTPTGRLEKPMLAIHTTYDQLVAPIIPNGYISLATEAGSGDLFAQQYVTGKGHCVISPAQVSSGFAELRAWVDSGKRPEGGAVPVH